MGEQGTWPSVCLKRFKMTHRMPQTDVLGSTEEIVSPPSQPFYLWIAQVLEGDKGSWETGNTITLVQQWWGCGLTMRFISALGHAQRDSTWSWKKSGLFLTTQVRAHTTANWTYLSRWVSERTQDRNWALVGWFGERSKDSGIPSGLDVARQWDNSMIGYFMCVTRTLLFSALSWL